MDTVTPASQTKLPNKIGRVIGETFLVIVRTDDVVCKRCVTLFNQFDQHESQMESIRNQLMGFISKKYAIDCDDRAPAAKLQKLNSGQATESTPTTNTPQTVVRKVMSQTMPVSPGSRKQPVKIYKCMSCDFTTGDLKQFTPHYAVCPGVAAENNGTATTGQAAAAAAVPTSNNHNSAGVSPASATSPASKVLARRPVTQTLQQKVENATNGTFACNVCAFKSQNKLQYDEHMRRHQVKIKPFKCRICSSRFEDRETASKHARAHSTEYYKCGTCSVAYRDRNQLIKHFEVHRNDGTGGQQIIIKGSSAAKTPAAKSTTTQGQSTQRLLQETIDEACSDNAGSGAVDAKNIHFFSCGICSLTFIQENYYTAHMETHKQPAASAVAGKKTVVSPKSAGARKTANGQSAVKGEVNISVFLIFSFCWI